MTERGSAPMMTLDLKKYYKKETNVGLDMFLMAKKYISGIDWDAGRSENGGFVTSELYKDIVKIAGLESIATDDTGAYVEVSVGYWRKANQIHGWFVDNVQEGRDDCNEYPVERRQLEELRTLCKAAIANKDHGDLPPVSGFFFGSNEIDDWYWNKLEDTVEILDRVLSYPDDIRFYYQSSW
jgi:hypothetical protein